MVIVVIGVAGAGKTTIGQRLAAARGDQFVDADDFHPPENLDKMRRGIALDDADREPWLDALARAIDGWLRRDVHVVLACSALKAEYRQTLRRDVDRVRFVYLKVDPETARQRLERRTGHFMRAGMVRRQFDALEEPSDAVVVDALQPPDEIVRRLQRALPADR